MMEKIFISVEKSSRMISRTKKYIGNDLENLQQELVFKFTDQFVNGSARLDYQIGNNKYHIPMTKDGETYTVPIKNVITKEGRIFMQLVIVQTAQDEEIPVFKSNVFDMYCNKSINAREEAPDDYEYWLDVIQTKLADIDDALEQVDNLDIDASKTGSVATISITNKEGITKSVEISDGTNGAPGQDGVDGKDAEINGHNVLTIEAGKNVTITEEDDKLIISAKGGGGGGSTTDYEDLDNLPQINSVELIGNKSLNDLGIQPAGNYLTSETDPVFIASAAYNITSSNISNWNNKGTYSKPSGGIPATDLASAVQTSLGKADTALQSISSSDVTTALGYTPYNSSNPNGYTSNTGTITSVKMNGSTISTSGEADLGTVITSHQDISGKENISNKVTSISSSSTDIEYPSAKAVYDYTQSLNKNILKNKKIICIGDSLNVGTKWGQYLINYSEADGENYGNGSAGFVSTGNTGDFAGMNFVQMLQYIINNKTQQELGDLDYLILGGGINDALNNFSIADITTNVQAFITLAKTSFPNAKIIMFPLHTFKWLENVQLSRYQAILQTIEKNGIMTTGDFLWWTIDDRTYDSSDHVHLTDDGYKLLANKVLSFVNGTSNVQVENLDFTLNTNFNNVNFSLTKVGNVVYAHGQIQYVGTGLTLNQKILDIAKGALVTGDYTENFFVPTLFYRVGYSGQESLGSVNVSNGEMQMGRPTVYSNWSNTYLYINGSWIIGRKGPTSSS